MSDAQSEGRGMKDDNFTYKLIIALMFISWMIGALIGANLQKGIEQREAVMKGHAEWIADQSGDAVFKWKEAK